MSYELFFLKALALTISTEMLMGAVLRYLLPKRFGFTVKWAKFLLFIAAASFMTLPYVWFLWQFMVADHTWYVVLSELWVWVVEAIFYIFAFEIKWRKALLFSLLINGFSFAVGLLVM